MDQYHHLNSDKATFRVLILVISLIVAFALIEAIGGYCAHSLALLGDSLHMFSDAAVLGISTFASWIALRPPSSRHSYGFGRAEVIAASISSILTFATALILFIEAISRLNHAASINSVPVMIISTIGIFLNLLIAFMLKNQKSLNIRAALLHVISDLTTTGATLISGIILFFSHWTMIDSIFSIFISILIAVSSAHLLRESMTVLMEGVPLHLNIRQVSKTIGQFNGVKSVHDIHIWTLSSNMTALSAHVNMKNLTTWSEVLVGLKTILKQKYHIDHITLQPEVDKDCDPCYRL